MDNEDLDDLNQKILEMTDKVDGIYTCKVCGKTAKDKTNLGKHIETHIDGLSFPCQECQKTYRSRESLRNHINTKHK